MKAPSTLASWPVGSSAKYDVTRLGAINGDSGGAESPTVFKAGDTYYWIGSYKTGWRANNNFYSTAPAIKGPWTYQGFLAPVADPSEIALPMYLASWSLDVSAGVLLQ